MVFTGGGDEVAIAQGVQDTYQTANLRYSQMAPIDMYEEKNTGTNLPAEIKISATDGDAYQISFHGERWRKRKQELPVSRNQSVAQRGNPAAMDLRKNAVSWHGRMPSLSPRNCDRGNVSGIRSRDRKAGLSKVPRRATNLGSALGHGFRDTDLEEKVLELSRNTGIGAQFGGKYLPRRPHREASTPRRILPGGDGGVMLGRPTDGRQNHGRRRLSGTSLSTPRSFPS